MLGRNTFMYGTTFKQVRHIAQMARSLAGVVLMTRYTQKASRSFEPQCDADGCEITAAHTDGTLNYCDDHWYQRAAR